MTASRPSLDEFERLVAKREYAPALQNVFAILDAIDSRIGRLDQVDTSALYPPNERKERALNFCARFASAFGQLMTDPGFSFTLFDFERLMSRHRWRDVIFELSNFETSDHLLRVVAEESASKTEPNKKRYVFANDNLLRALAIMTLNSHFELGFDRCWKAKPWASATAFVHYLGSRYTFSPKAFQFRERLLEWLPNKLDEIKLGQLTLAMVASAYMHCSYAITPRKHEIKAALARQMRRACLQAGCKELSVAQPANPPGERPTIIVVTEFFSRNHSVFRTHSEMVRSLRDRFHLVGLHLNPTDKPVVEYFDECITVPRKNFFADLKAISDDILSRKPALIFYLGVGMVSHVIALATLRLAPIQCVSFGHTASTMSPVMDYMLLPEDFVGSTDCFTEKVLALPRKAMPFIKPPVLTEVSSKKRVREKSDVVRVAIAASIMKLNPPLFTALARIAKAAKSKVEFHFFPLLSVGLAQLVLSKEVHKYLPDAIVHPQMPLAPYFNQLARCDLFLCPFPYGNMNSIVDGVTFGLPGVCLDGPEAHSHADVGIFARIGLPTELAAKTVDEYVDAAVKLIDDAKWRARCQKIAENCDLDDAFFRGEPEIFAQAIADLIWPTSKTKAKARA